MTDNYNKLVERLACKLCDLANPQTQGTCDINRKPRDTECSWLWDAEKGLVTIFTER